MGNLRCDQQKMWTVRHPSGNTHSGQIRKHILSQDHPPCFYQIYYTISALSLQFFSENFYGQEKSILAALYERLAIAAGTFKHP